MWWCLISGFGYGEPTPDTTNTRICGGASDRRHKVRRELDEDGATQGSSGKT
jgi:hypothetical protein